MTDETNKREKITVVATQKGYYQRVRTPEDSPAEFEIYEDEFSEKWMKRVTVDEGEKAETKPKDADGDDGKENAEGDGQGENAPKGDGKEAAADKVEKPAVTKPKAAKKAAPAKQKK